MWHVPDEKNKKNQVIIMTFEKTMSLRYLDGFNILLLRLEFGM